MRTDMIKVRGPNGYDRNRLNIQYSRLVPLMAITSPRCSKRRAHPVWKGTKGPTPMQHNPTVHYGSVKLNKNVCHCH